MCRLKARTTNCDAARHAFTFLEVLFSVMILGIGMIMVAAMFPAAIKQTQANVEDGSSASIAQLADNTMQLYADSRDINSAATPPTVQAWSSLDRLLNTTASPPPVTPIVYSFHDPRLPAPPASNYSPATAWQMIAPNLVLPNDPQYAWVPLFDRGTLGTAANTPQGPYTATATLERSFRLFLIPVRCRNRSSGYIGNPGATGSDVAVDPTNDPTNLDPALVNINFIAATATVPAYFQVVSAYYGSNASQSSPLGGGINPQFNPIATGAYIVVSNSVNNSAYNGSIFKVGTQVQSDGTGIGTTGEFWSIAPDPLGATVGAAFTADYALVVGRGPDTSSAAYQAWQLSPSTSPMPRAGVAQDMGIFLTVVALP